MMHRAHDVIMVACGTAGERLSIAYSAALSTETPLHPPPPRVVLAPGDVHVSAVTESVRRHSETFERAPALQLCFAVDETSKNNLHELMPALRDALPDALLFASPWLPSCVAGGPPSSSYGSAVALCALAEHAHLSLVLDRDAISNVRGCAPADDVAAHIVACFAAPCDGGSGALRRAAASLVPFPRLHLCAPSPAPLSAFLCVDADAQAASLTEAQIVRRCCGARATLLGPHAPSEALPGAAMSRYMVLQSDMSLPRAAAECAACPGPPCAVAWAPGGARRGVMARNGTQFAVVLHAAAMRFQRAFNRRAGVAGYLARQQFALEEADLGAAGEGLNSWVEEYAGIAAAPSE